MKKTVYCLGESHKKTKPHKTPAPFMLMGHQRVMTLLTPKQRELIAEFFDEHGKQATRLDQLPKGPSRAALACYGRLREEVGKWLKNHPRSDSGAFIFSIPEFVWFQPDLSLLEKHLLADVWGLQQGPLGCFKSDLYFAIQFGTSPGNVKDMVWRLKQARFLKEVEGGGDKRLLELSDSFLHCAGQYGQTKRSVHTDLNGSGNLPAGQPGLTPLSVHTDGGKGHNPGKTPVNTGEKFCPPEPREQRSDKEQSEQTQQETEAASRPVVVEPSVQEGLRPSDPTKGASPLRTPHASEKPHGHRHDNSRTHQFKDQGTSPASGTSKFHRNNSGDGAEHQTPDIQINQSHAAANAPAAHTANVEGHKEPNVAPAPVPENTVAGTADPAQPDAASTVEADKFVRFFELSYPLIFQEEHRCGTGDLSPARSFFQLHPDRSALQLANYTIRAWKLSFRKNGDYNFPLCKQGKTVRGFFKWFEPADGVHGIVNDVENFHGGFWDDDQAWLIDRLMHVCPDAKEVIQKVFSIELAQAEEDKKAEMRAAAAREREEAKQREQARQQEDQKLNARIKNPSKDDRKQSIEVVQKALEIASGSRTGQLFPSPARLNHVIKILGVELPALREWFDNYGNPALSRGAGEKKVPDDLVRRLRCELDAVGAVAGTI